MGKEKIYAIQILNLDTGIKVKHQLDNSELFYEQLLQILQSYNPQIDFENIVIYYYTSCKWLILLEQKLNLDDPEFDWQDKQSDQTILHIKYNCVYLLQEDEEKRFHDDIKKMSQKINDISQLYQQLKEKYKQQALDINIFWGSPLFTDDQLQRSKKPIQTIHNSQGQSNQLLINQIRYAPYINAVTTALDNCNRKKILLELNLLNQKSFSQRSVFTVVYLMAHLEIQQVKANKKDYKKPHKQKKKQINRQKKQYQNQKIKINFIKQTKSQTLKEQKIKQEIIYKKSLGENSQMVMTITQQNNTIKQNQSIIQNNTIKHVSQSISQNNKEQNQTQISKNSQSKSITNSQIKNISQQADNQDIYYQKDHRNQRRGFKYYFLGEEVNGKLYKISPKKLRSIIKNRISRKIQLLILHSSFPNYHLEQIKDLANNIILINSNPLYPQPSSIYFIKQFFTHLVQTGNISQTYTLSIEDLNRLKQVSLSGKNSNLLKEFDEKQITFIQSINQKYVHGNLQCCCCYHPHEPRCHNKRTTSPSKYAQYHYKYHAKQCECLQQDLMIHSCDDKKEIMIDHYDILHKEYNYDEYYYCCCLGTKLGYYEYPMKNERFDKLVSQQKDPHGIKAKYKYEKKMINEQDNQLQINEGKITGDWNKQIIQAFKYIQQNPLLGNTPLLVRLLEIYTKQLEHFSLDVLKTTKNQMYILSNIYGQKSTGKKSIATYFAKLLLIKKMCQRIIIKVFTNASMIKNIIQTQLNDSTGRPFFIFIHVDKNSRFQKNQLKLSQYNFGYPVSAIIITQQQIINDSSISMQYFQPVPFNNDNCQHYIKKYKHLKFQQKGNIKTLFSYGTKGYDLKQKFEIFPFSLNQFEILNIVRKTNFYKYKNFTHGLDRIHKDYIHYYIFITYMIKFTNTPIFQRKFDTLNQIENKLKNYLIDKSLFYKKYDQNIDQENHKQDIDNYKNSIINLDQFKDNFYLIFTSTGYKYKKKLPNILKMFINYTSILPATRFEEDWTIRRKTNYLRTKNNPFFKQVYEATTINENSYINRYFKAQITQIYKTFAKNKEEQSQQSFDFQSFLQFHSTLLANKKYIHKKLSYDTHSKPKQKIRTEHYSSLDQNIRDSARSSHTTFILQPQQNFDIPHIYHLASIIEGGLQFVRNVVSTHFIYNRLSQDQKIQLLKYSLILINNCLILLKNKKFYDLKDEQDYDVEFYKEDLFTSQSPKRVFLETHSSRNLDSPDLKSVKSEQGDFPPPNSRTNSKRQVFFENRQLSIDHASVIRKDSKQQESHLLGNNELLLKELHRLSTFRGLLFLIAEIQRRSQQFTNQNIVRVKICAQLLAIQIRLEQLQEDKQSTKVVVSPLCKDRYLLRIAQIFNQKNYNINILYKILREQINLNRFNRDIEQLGLIKSHIIVSLALMASRYGKYKIAKAKSMVSQIDSFITEWNQGISLQRRQSQQDENRNIKNEQLLKFKQLPSEYSFLKMICQNQYVYIHILQSFTSQKFWPRQIIKNDEIQAYKNILGIYHHFTLKNTKTKINYYKKLQKISKQLNNIKISKQFIKYSTYIHNFIDYFYKLLENQFKKIKSNFITIFNADDQRDYVKFSLHQQLQTTLNNKNNQKQFFSIKKKFNQIQLSTLANNQGCQYLCIFTSIGENNSRQQILIQGNDGRCDIKNKEIITQTINSIPYSVIFVCLPRKKMLAQSIIQTNKIKDRIIVYFNFQIQNFTRSNDQKSIISEHITIFEKMIMIQTIRQIIQQIIQKQNNGFKKGFYMAYNDIKNKLSFILRNKQGKQILKLQNKQFRKCLLKQQQDFFYPKQIIDKKIQFQLIQKVNKNQIQQLQKIIKKSITFKDKIQQFKIDHFYNIHNFIQTFSFYLRNKYAFNHIFNINFQIWKSDLIKKPQNKSNVIVTKKFLEKLIQQKILDFIFSSKKGAITMYFEPQYYDLYSNQLKNCENELKNIINSIDLPEGKRTISRFLGCSRINQKKVSHILIYILQNPEKPDDY